MPLLRRKPSSPPPLLVTDMAMGDVEVAYVRDLAVQRGHWQPAADLLSTTASSPDRRGVLVEALGEAAVQPAPWLDAWCAARPDDPGLHCALVSTTVARAWDTRGSGWASQTGEDQFAAFHRLLSGRPRPVPPGRPLRWQRPHALDAVAGVVHRPGRAP